MKPPADAVRDIAAALENLTEIHDYLVEDRRPL
jgi:hypothetical protein